MADEAEKQVLYQPKKMYNTMLKKQYHDTAASYFDDLCAKSGVSKEENAALVKKYEQAADKYNEALKTRNKLAGTKALLIALAVVSFVVAIVGIFFGASGNEYSFIGWIMLGVGIALGILFIVIEVMKVKKKLAAAQAVLDEAKKMNNKQ